jgi:cobalt-zinc-cadmium efflux system outer membrane protein
MPTTFKIWLASALLACALPGSLAFAQPTEGLAFEELEARLSDHPSLTALTYQAEASRERGTAATALPDPVVSVGVNNFPIFDPSFSDFLPTNKAVGVRQDFPKLVPVKRGQWPNRRTASALPSLQHCAVN